MADITGNPSSIEAQSMTLAGWAAIFDAVTFELNNTLMPREAKIIRLYYGLDDSERKPPEQIGSLFDVSGKKAEDIRHYTSQKLRHPTRMQRIQNVLFPKIISFKGLMQNFDFCSTETSGEAKKPEERFIKEAP